MIKRVDTVRAYTFGVLYFVEVRMLIYRDQIYMVQLLGNTILIDLYKIYIVWPS